MITTETVNHRNLKVLEDGTFIGWLTVSTLLMGEPRWGFKDPTGVRPATGWNYPTVSECLEAVGR